MLILIAEDEPLVAFALECVLSLAGHRVLGPADNVVDALALADRAEPDLALIDIDLRHGDDGTQLARALRERFGTPILFISAQAGRARACRHLALGLIPKPYDTDIVLQAVNCIGDIAEGRQPRRAPAQVEFFQHFAAN